MLVYFLSCFRRFLIPVLCTALCLSNLFFSFSNDVRADAPPLKQVAIVIDDLGNHMTGQSIISFF
jgi:polysaccharide deacetylase 2 family uncharacterized protein YibQ